jgi:hypothetical protein
VELLRIYSNFEPPVDLSELAQRLDMPAASLDQDS